MYNGRVNPFPARRAAAWRGRLGVTSRMVATYPTHTNDQRTLGPSGVGARDRPGLDREAARPLWTALDPCQMRLQERCVSHSISRRRRWRTCATTLALTLGSLAVPAAALADGQLDPAFNGTGYHLGTAARARCSPTPTTASR